MLAKALNSFLEYLLCFLILVTMRSVFVHVFGDENPDRLFRILIFLNVISLILINIKSFYLHKKELIAFFIYLLFVGMLLFYNTFLIVDGLLSYFFNLILLLPSFWILVSIYLINHKIDKLFKKFIQLVLLICSVSLIFWFFGSILHIIHPTMELPVTWATDMDFLPIRGYWGVYFETQEIYLLGFSGWRNTAFFVEGPMFNFILVITLALLLFLDYEYKLYKILLILLTIGTTFSTTGIFISALLVLYRIYFVGKMTRNNLLILIFFSPIIIGYTLSFLYDLGLDKAKTSSALMRIDDIFAGAKAWVDSPFLGHGYRNLEPIIQYMNMVFRPNVGYSNGIFSILVQGGVVLFLLCFLPSLLFLCKKKTVSYIKFLILLWLGLLFSTIIDTTPLFLFVCGLSYSILFYKSK